MIINLPSDDHLSIDMVDVSGKAIMNIYTGSGAPGANTFPVNTGTLSPGVYFYRISIGHRIKYLKLVKC